MNNTELAMSAAFIVAMIGLPVDVEHVLAAIVLAARNGKLNPNIPLSSDDPALAEILVVHVKTVFADYGGRLGTDD